MIRDPCRVLVFFSVRDNPDVHQPPRLVVVYTHTVSPMVVDQRGCSLYLSTSFSRPSPVRDPTLLGVASGSGGPSPFPPTSLQYSSLDLELKPVYGPCSVRKVYVLTR